MIARTDYFGKSGWIILTLVLLLPSWGVTETRSVNCNAGGSIGEALKTLKPGDTLLVSGTCVESVNITEQFDGITLDGQGTATVNGPDPAVNPIQLVAVRNVTIKGLRVTGGRDGINLRGAQMIFIENNIIEQTGRDGMQVHRGTFAMITGNTIQNNARHGIVVHESSSARIGFASATAANEPRPNLIQGNGGNGIHVLRASNARIAANTIRNNRQNGINVERVSQADIASNTIEGNARNGIRVTQNSGVQLGADTGTGFEELPNSTGTPNGQYGLDCSLGAYADGRLGSLMGRSGATNFTWGQDIVSLLP